MLLFGNQFLITGMTFSPDDRWLAAGSEDGPSRLWGLQQQEMPELKGKVPPGF